MDICTVSDTNRYLGTIEISDDEPSWSTESQLSSIERLGLPGRRLGEEGLLVQLGALLRVEAVPIVMSTSNFEY